MEMVTVRYTGLAPMGTITPRRMWRRGDKAKVTPEVAEEILRDRSFVKVRVRTRKKKTRKAKTKPVEKDPTIDVDPE